MDIKYVESITIDVLTKGYTLSVSGRESQRDYRRHSEAFNSKKDLVKFIERALEA